MSDAVVVQSTVAGRLPAKRIDATEQVDAKAMFQALQSELNSRVQARAAINTTHIQTIAALVVGYFVTRSNLDKTALLNTGKGIPILSCLIGTLVPFVSYYFVGLYRHNDMQIGLLNQCLGRIEDQSARLQFSNRFYRVDGMYAKSWEARTHSHDALWWLCCASPILYIGEIVFLGISSVGEGPPLAVVRRVIDQALLSWLGVALMISASISIANIRSLKQAQEYRDQLIDERRRWLIEEC